MGRRCLRRSPATVQPPQNIRECLPLRSAVIAIDPHQGIEGTFPRLIMQRQEGKDGKVYLPFISPTIVKERPEICVHGLVARLDLLRNPILIYKHKTADRLLFIPHHVPFVLIQGPQDIETLLLLPRPSPGREEISEFPSPSLPSPASQRARAFPISRSGDCRPADVRRRA